MPGDEFFVAHGAVVIAQTDVEDCGPAFTQMTIPGGRGSSQSSDPLPPANHSIAGVPPGPVEEGLSWISCVHTPEYEIEEVSHIRPFSRLRNDDEVSSLNSACAILSLFGAIILSL